MRVEQLEDTVMGNAGHAALDIHHPTFNQRVMSDGTDQLKEHAALTFAAVAERGIPIVETFLDSQYHGVSGVITPLRRVFRVAFLAPESAQMLTRGRLVRQTVTVGVHDLHGRDQTTGETYEHLTESCDIMTTFNVMRTRKKSGVLVGDPGFSKLDGKQVIERLNEHYPVFRSPHAGQYTQSILPFNIDVDSRAEKECDERQAQMRRADIVEGLIAGLVQIEEILSNPSYDSRLLFPTSR